MTRALAIDTHVHFWELESYRPFSGWFHGKSFLEEDYLPERLKPGLDACNVESAVIVGAGPDSDEHNLFCADLVERYAYISGLVGSYSFENEDLGKALDLFANKSWFVGIRARPASPPDDWLDDANAKAGMDEMRRRNLTLDILVDQALLPAVATFAGQHEDVPLVVNHCGLPPFRSGDLSAWAVHISELAKRPNVHMKYSSFFLHCHPNCQTDQLQFAADTLFENFGTKRLLWGSNWPPELFGGTYEEAYQTMLGHAGDLSDDEYNQVFRENALRVYGLGGL
ncbi:amidohydrolase family protein [Chloroflexi bacterium TSY]|nr:amidohydrolase family protein [Chloroflexi bacterium TSY]